MITPAALASVSCEKAGARQAHPPLALGSGIVCFIFQPVTDDLGRTLDGEGPQIAVYFTELDKPPVMAGELPYLATTGRIKDAFVLDIDQDKRLDVVVIHSAEVRSETDVRGAFYSVLAFTHKQDGALNLNEQISRWFGSGGDTPQTSGTNGYVFPYKTRASIQAAAALPLFRLSSVSCPLPGTVNTKAPLYHSPVPQDKTKMYLVKGDKVTIEDVTAGWCEATYNGGKKPLQMWLHCSAIRL